MRKRGYFFTLDAFIAIGILAAGLILVYLSQSFEPPTVQTGFLSQDLMEILSNTELSDINNPYIDEHRISGNITNIENTVIEQIGEFYVTNMIGEAQNLTKNVTFNLVPVQYSFEIFFDDKLIHNNNILPQETPMLSSSKTIVVGILDNNFWGPYKAEVRVWQQGANAGTTTIYGICETADNDGLCGGLDIVFYPGYEVLCCSEHGYCC